MISEEVESQAYHCNKKKKSAKTVEVQSTVHVHTYTLFYWINVCAGAEYGDVLRHIHKGQTHYIYRVYEIKNGRMCTCTLHITNTVSVYTNFTVAEYLIQESGCIRARGIVVQVLDRAFDVLVQGYGVIKRVYCEVMYYTLAK